MKIEQRGERSRGEEERETGQLASRQGAQRRKDLLGTERVSIKADDVVGIHNANGVAEALVEGEETSGSRRLVCWLVEEVVGCYPRVPLVAVGDCLPNTNSAICSNGTVRQLGAQSSAPRGKQGEPWNSLNSQRRASGRLLSECQSLSEQGVSLSVAFMTIVERKEQSPRVSSQSFDRQARRGGRGWCRCQRRRSKMS